jgi:DNA invertase Pin-like site-specific DNA recombinase
MTNLKEPKVTTRRTGQLVGYLRVSTLDQNEGRQLDGVELDRRFVDKASGKDTDRPQLDAMLLYVREGDVVVVHSLDRLARNLDDLRRLVLALTKKGVRVKFMKENLEFSGDDSPMSHLLLSVMGAFAQFERDLIRERQKEGIALAKKKGVYTGRVKALKLEQVEELRRRVASGVPLAAVARDLKVSRMTAYRYLKATEVPA